MSDFKKIAEDIVHSYEARARIVGGIVDDTQDLLKSFRERREEMSKGLREVLAKSENLRKKDFNRMMEDILKTQAEREDNVKQMLADFRQEEEMVSGRFRKLLMRGEKIRLRDFKKIVSQIRQDQDERQKKVKDKTFSELSTMQNEVGIMLAQFKEEREKMSTAWKEIAGNLSQK
jgi:hypothetical protein